MVGLFETTGCPATTAAFFGASVVAAFAGGPISGGAFNPAVGIGPTLMHAVRGGGTMRHLWLYIVGPLVGGALAAVVFRAQGQAD